jgi:hydroxyacylglutathione hydrolase
MERSDKMIIKVLQVGMIGTNCFIVGCPQTNEAMIIDPGDEGEKIMDVVKKSGLKVTSIVNTHGHWDHIGANQKVKELSGAPMMIHEKDAAFLTDGKLNMASFMRDEGKGPAADIILKEGDNIKVGQLVFKVLHTPGHTPGGISLVGDKTVFVGDTLFFGSIGRTDLPGGDYKVLINSIKEKLLPLGDDFVVYPGHGPQTSIGKEKKSNPFIV